MRFGGFMNTLMRAARLLEIPAKNKPLESDVQYLTFLNRGLPLKSIYRISAAIAPQDKKFPYRIVPKATFARKKKIKGRLSKPQSELVTRLAEVWTDALRVWKTEDDARSFLNRSHPLLENKRPVDLALQSEVGAQLVRDVLGRLEHGTAV
jgi:putative toxin-antitoxin system antitoxin component (TIGR02293 family)